MNRSQHAYNKRYQRPMDAPIRNIPQHVIDKAREQVHVGQSELAIETICNEPSFEFDPNALRVLHMALHYVGDKENARIWWDRGMELLCRVESGYLANKSLMLAEENSLDEALEAGLRAREIYSLWHLPHVNVSNALLLQGRVDEAWDTLENEMTKMWPTYKGDDRLSFYLLEDGIFDLLRSEEGGLERISKLLERTV